MENKRFLTANDVAEYMGISVPMAYKIMPICSPLFSGKWLWI